MSEMTYKLIKEDGDFLGLTLSRFYCLFIVAEYFNLLSVHKNPSLFELNGKDNCIHYNNSESQAIATSLQQAYDLFTSNLDTLTNESLRKLIQLEEIEPLPGHLKVTSEMKEQVSKIVMNIPGFSKCRIIDPDDPYVDYEDFLELWIFHNRHVDLKRVVDFFKSGKTSIQRLTQDNKVHSRK
ncbi:MAG: hypothetical protein JSS62_07145 [Verrucomicrobia bacterium]|nr:hypothetical protein [Verrucomicrobiota bacterium]MBS0645877.1 hypothetical protein [Verrucomicrobiota bacterium]